MQPQSERGSADRLTCEGVVGKHNKSGGVRPVAVLPWDWASDVGFCNVDLLHGQACQGSRKSARQRIVGQEDV